MTPEPRRSKASACAMGLDARADTGGEDTPARHGESPKLRGLGSQGSRLSKRNALEDGKPLGRPDSPRPRHRLLVFGLSMRIGSLSLLLTGLFACPAFAMGQSATDAAVKLSWVRSESALDCIGPSALESELAERMGKNPFEGTAGQWIEGYASRADGGYEVQLFERDANGKTIGSRRFTEQSDNCRELDDAIELAIALIIDPNVKLSARASPHRQALPVEHNESRPAQPSSQAASAPPAPLSPLKLSPVPKSTLIDVVAKPSPVLRLHDAPTKGGAEVARSSDLSAAAFVIEGLLPGATGGVELGTRFSEGLLALRLGLRFSPERSPGSQLGDFGFGATLFNLGGCALWKGPRLEWLNCLEAGAGAIHVTVYRPSPLEPGDRLFKFAGIESGLSVRLRGPVWLDTRLFALVPLGRWDFRLIENGQSQSIFRQSWFMPGAAIGLSVRIF